MKKNIFIIVIATVLFTTLAKADGEFEASQVSFDTQDRESMVVSSIDVKELKGNLNKAQSRLQVLAVKVAIEESYALNNQLNY